MPESTVLTDPATKPLGIEIREKSFQQILKEQQTERDKPVDEKPPVADPKIEEEKKAAQEAEEAKQKIEEEEQEKKRQEDIAAKAAEEVIVKQRAEEQAKLDKIRQEEEEKQRQETLKPKWKTDPNAPKDEQGNPLPRSYDEIQEEAARIAEEKAYARITAEMAKREAEQARVLQEKTQTEEQQKANKKAFEDQLQSELDADMMDIYAAGDLPKIKDPKDENDPGNKEIRNLFEIAQKVNADRMAAGKQPIRSIKLIRYAKDEKGKPYYQPLPKPAGHNAPVIGNESTISQELPEDKYIVSRDRNKSITQMIKEETARRMKSLNIRGK